MCVYYVYTFFLIGCVGSVGIFLASRAMYLSRVCVSACGVPGRYEYIWALWWCGRRDCTDFSSLWLCSGGYSTGKMVRGGWSVFPAAFLQFAVSFLGGWISAVGFLCYISFD